MFSTQILKYTLSYRHHPETAIIYYVWTPQIKSWNVWTLTWNGPIEPKYCTNHNKTYLKWSKCVLMTVIKCYLEVDRTHSIWCNTLQTFEVMPRRHIYLRLQRTCFPESIKHLCWLVSSIYDKLLGNNWLIIIEELLLKKYSTQLFLSWD